jgi:gluconokinase
LGCSALKERYREILGANRAGVTIVLLSGSSELIRPRLDSRKGHFMNPALLESQLETLEPPPQAIVVEVTGSPEEIARKIKRALASAERSS